VHAGFGHKLLVAFGVLTIADEANLARRGRDAPHFRNFDVSISVSD
jgi:hypothetical protein